MKMKLHLIILLFIFSFSIPLSAQNWLPTGTTWHYNNSIWGRPAPTQIVEIIGTTEILGRTCAILERELTSCNQRPKVDYMYKENDSLFYYDGNLNTFQLLYDFSAQVGDITAIPLWEGMTRPFSNDTTLFIRIDSISTFLLDSLELKRFDVTYSFDINNFSPSLASFYIEDIGSFGNFFHRVENGFCDGFHVAGLRCFNTPGFDLLSYIGPMEECDLIISTEDEKGIPPSPLLLSPNPAYEKLNISGFSESSIVEWNIYDLGGKLLLNGQEQLFENSSLNINIAELPASIYFLAIRNEQSQVLFSERFIKQ